MNTKLILTAVIFFAFGAVLTYSLNQLQPVASKATISNPLGLITGVKTTKGTIYLLIDQNSVHFRPFEDMDTIYKTIDLKKKDYPKLFEQGVANSSVLQAEEYVDPEGKEMFIKLSNSQPDHGGYASTYVLLVNPFTGEIKEGKNDYSSAYIDKYFPIQKGDYWVYQGIKREEMEGGEVNTSNVQKRVEVLDIQDIPDGQLVVLGGSEPLKYFIRDNTIDFDPDKPKEAKFTLKLPLSVGQKWGDEEFLKRDDGFYIYQVEEKLSKDILGKKYDDCFRITYKTNADLDYRVFCYGLGIVEEGYKHNGTILEWDFKLTSSNKI